MRDYLVEKYPLQIGRNNPILRHSADPVLVFDDEIADFCEDIMDLMWIYEGVGLAAPQIGVSSRIIAVTQWKKTKTKMKNTGEMVMINPKIIEHSDEVFVSEEACLSLPGESGNVDRFEEINVSYQDMSGKTFEKKFVGFDAAIIQHEIDHLDGVLFVDKERD